MKILKPKQQAVSEAGTKISEVLTLAKKADL
jgi:hypothetical protein